ncbi:MAG TPA: hypothetical protein VGK99_09125 [Acidobacteriota bacterium]|jgi:type IV secretion system protein VirB10
MKKLAIAIIAIGSVLGADLDSLVIPAKTDIFVTLKRGISTRTAAPGDKFYGEVAVPVTIKDEIVIPEGSTIIGHVESLRRPGHLKGKGELELRFDSVILPDGVTRDMRAVVSSTENYSTNRVSQTEGTVVAGGTQAGETAEGAVKGAVTGAPIGAIAGAVRGGALKGAGVGGMVGAAGGALLGVFKRGKDVEFRRGDSITIQLTDAVRLVTPEPPAQGQRLK